jgi:hypothetical protein
MGLSNKTTNTSAQQQNTATTTPNVPDWISQPAQNMAGGINSLIGQGPAAFSPITNPTQQAAYTGAANLTTPTDDPYSGVSSAINGINPVTGESVLSGLQSYMNPYESDIIDPTLAAYDQQSGMTQAAQAAAAARNNAFGGSRYGVQEAQTAQQLAMGRAQTQAGLLQSEYGTAAGMSEADAARRQQAALANQGVQVQQAGMTDTLASQQAQLEAQRQADARANIGVQAGTGQQEYENQTQQSQFPIQYQQMMEGLLSGLNPSLYTGQTVTGSGTSSGTSTANQSLGSWFGDFLTSVASSAAKGAGSAAAMGA